MENQKELFTQEERIELIRQAVEQTKGVALSDQAQEFVEDVKTEELVVEHGLLDTQKEDLEDESQFLFSDSAEDIDEEDESVGVSSEMRQVYNNN